MPQAIVIKPHKSIYPNPIKLNKDEQVTIGKKDSEWEGWIWCTSPSGVEGWVPENILIIENSHAIVKQTYDATELDVVLDEKLTMIREESGWYWCKKENGSEGWVPCECMKV